MDFADIVARMSAEVRGELQGPVTLYHMTALFEEYRRAVKLAEHNRSGRNPSFPGKAGEAIGAKLQAKADRLARDFPAFPQALKKVENS